MLSFEDLSPAKKRWVELVEIHFPHITDTITYQEIHDIHKFFTDKRSEHKRYKTSLALWLITNNKTSRGVYKFPGSSLGEIQDENAEPDSPMEVLYKQELLKFGIKPKK